jgi:hypothetical protein
VEWVLRAKRSVGVRDGYSVEAEVVGEGDGYRSRSMMVSTVRDVTRLATRRCVGKESGGRRGWR